MRIGVFGGCFDPIHLGHLLVADDTRRKLNLNQVLFIPSFHPPHRAAPLTPYLHRKAMVKAAIKDHPLFALCDIEENLPGPSYTINTLSELHRLFPRDRIYLIIGYDQYWTIKTWFKAEEIIKWARLVVISRPGFNQPPLFLGHNRGQVLFLEVIPVAIAAADVRARIAKGMSIRYLVPSVVCHYIYQHNLYRLAALKFSNKQRRLNV